MSPRAAFAKQRANAAERGIEWRLTFDEWLAWWGDDLSRRGVKVGDLCMQRIADTGPYALDNIRKGDAGQNAKTRGAMLRKRAAARAKAEREARLNALMWAPSLEPFDDPKAGAPIAQNEFGRQKGLT